MKQKLNIDHVFSHTGEMGPQQIRYLVLMSVMTMYSPQFMIQVNRTCQSFINFMMYISEKMSQFDHFQKLPFIILVCVCVCKFFTNSSGAVFCCIYNPICNKLIFLFTPAVTKGKKLLIGHMYA